MPAAVNKCKIFLRGGDFIHGFCEPYPICKELHSKDSCDEAHTDQAHPDQDPREKDTVATGKRIAVVADLPAEGEESVLREMVVRFVEYSSATCDLINIREFPYDYLDGTSIRFEKP